MPTGPSQGYFIQPQPQLLRPMPQPIVPNYGNQYLQAVSPHIPPQPIYKPQIVRLVPQVPPRTIFKDGEFEYENRRESLRDSYRGNGLSHSANYARPWIGAEVRFKAKSKKPTSTAKIPNRRGPRVQYHRPKSSHVSYHDSKQSQRVVESTSFGSRNAVKSANKSGFKSQFAYEPLSPSLRAANLDGQRRRRKWKSKLATEDLRRKLEDSRASKFKSSSKRLKSIVKIAEPTN